MPDDHEQFEVERFEVERFEVERFEVERPRVERPRVERSKFEGFGNEWLPIRTWPVTAEREFPARSAYVELVWSGVLGPTTLLTYRRLTGLLDVGGHEVNLPDLAAGLGVRYQGGRHSAMVRALDRLVLFKAATFDGDALAVRAGLPPVPEHRLARLGHSAIRVHTRALLTHHADPPVPGAAGRPVDRERLVASRPGDEIPRLHTDATIPPARPPGPDRTARRSGPTIRFGRT
jgi:hypothetical protein